MQVLMSVLPEQDMHILMRVELLIKCSKESTELSGIGYHRVKSKEKKEDSVSYGTNQF